MSTKGSLAVLASEGSKEILSFLTRKWQDFEERRDSSPATTFKKLEEVVKVSTRTLNDRLKELVDLGLVSKEGRNYSITNLGTLLYPLLRKIEMLQHKGRNVFAFYEENDPRAWYSEMGGLILRARKEFLIVARRLTSLSIPEVQRELYPLFREAANRRGVTIHVIADPSMPKEVQKAFVNEFKAEIKYMDAEFLLNPPGILKPVFLDNFCHIVITDRTHWLGLFPHERGGKHSGRRCIADPVTSEYLAEIFDTLWTLADYTHYSSHEKIESARSKYSARENDSLQRIKYT